LGGIADRIRVFVFEMIDPRKSRPLRYIHSVLLLGILALSTAAVAEKLPDLKPTNYVNDFAGVIDPATQTRLNALAREVQDKAHAQIAIVTVKSLEDRPVEDFAVDLFKAWGVGGKSDNRGVLILLSSGDRKYRVEVGYGLEPILPDGKVGGFGREIVPLLKENNYSAAVSLLTTRIAQTIAEDANVTLTGVQQLPRHRRQGSPDKSLLAVLAPFIPILLIFFIISMLNRGRGGRGGGYWMGGGYGGGGWGGGGGGGFGGGGDFGGFGGGSSGGGGAGGSW
jgi:uncharacterized protein